MQGALKKYFTRFKIAQLFYFVKRREGKSPVGGGVKHHWEIKTTQ